MIAPTTKTTKMAHNITPPAIHGIDELCTLVASAALITEGLITDGGDVTGSKINYSMNLLFQN